MLIEELYYQDGFSDAEIKIAEYILHNGENICTMSIQDLAANTYSSPSAIMRLCKKLDTKGFSEFKIKLKGEFVEQKNKNMLENLDFPFIQEDKYKDVAEKLYKITNLSLSAVKSALDFNMINRIVNSMKKIDIFDIYGQGSSQASAFEFKGKLVRLGKCVQMEPGLPEQLNLAINSNESHFAILISHSGENKETLRVAKILSKTRTPSLAITGEKNTPLSKYCQFNICTCVRETKFLMDKLEIYGSYIASQFVLELLYSCMFLTDYEKNYRKTKNNENLIRNSES